MHAQTHLLSGWCLANWLNVGPRERLFCMIVSVCADIDAISIVGGQEAYWAYHHVVGHNILVGLVVAGVLAALSRHRIKGLLAYLGLFHVHLLMDLFGSGPKWSVAYFWPFSRWAAETTYAWEFRSWQNFAAAGLSFLWTIWIVYRRKRTPLEVLMPSLDRKFVALTQRKTKQ